VTRTDGKWDVQFASRRTLFTFDLGGGLDYYWDRPGKKTDWTGNVAMTYLQKLSGRAQFTFSLDGAYQSQPDFSQPNEPTSPNVGSYFTLNAKADLSYRLTPRFSAVASVTYNTLQYMQSTEATDNYATTIVGTELRYLLSPRYTLVGEVRASQDKHSNEVGLDTNSYYLLLGTDVALSRRFTGTLRLGEVLQTFTESGDSASSPYGELSLNYRLSPATSVAWTARYGYEESNRPNSQNIVARTGLQLFQIFTPRFQSVLSVNLVNSKLTNTISAAGNVNPVNPGAINGSALSSSPTVNGTTTNNDSVTDTIDASLAFYYTLNRHWSLNLTYSYTTGLGPIAADDYFRQRVFLGASYQF
jgi:hypothetical protein